MLNRSKIKAYALVISILAALPIVTEANAATEIISDNLALADVDAINSAKLGYGDTTIPEGGYDGWFNVGYGSSAASTGYNLPGGGVLLSNGGVQLSTSKSGIAHALYQGSTQDKTGVFEIKFSVLPNGSEFGTDIMGSLDNLYSQYEGSTKRKEVLLNVSSDGKIIIPTASNPAINTMANAWLAGMCNVNDWLDVTAIINLDQQASMIAVKQNGIIVAKQLKNNAGLGEDIKNNGLGYIRFITSASGNGGPTVRNICVRKTDIADNFDYPGYGEQFDYTLTESGFSKTNLISASTTSTSHTSYAFNNSGWYITADEFLADDIDFVNADGETYIEASYSENNKIKQIGTVVKPTWMSGLKGITHLAYRVKINSTAGTIRALCLGNGIPATLEFRPYSKTVRVNGDTDAAYSDTNSTVIGSYDPESWVDVDQYVDIPNRKWFVVVRQNGAVVAKAMDVFVRNTLAENGISDFRFDFIASSNVAPSLCMSNLQIETVDAVNIAPEINEDNISFEDKSGNLTSLRENDISPLVENIKLDFGIAMPNPIGTEGITLSGDGENIDFTLSRNAEKETEWILTPHTILSSAVNYTLYFPSTIKSQNGVALYGGDKSFEFYTANVYPIYHLANITMGSEAVSFLNAINSGDVVTLNTEAINTSSEDKNLMWVLAYYDDCNNLIDAYAETKTIFKHSILEQQDMPKFTMNIPQNADIAKFYFWDADNLTPHSAVSALESYGIYANFGEADNISNLSVASQWESELYEGRYSRRIPNSSSVGNVYLRCNVDDNIMYNIEDGIPIDIEVEYFDGENGWFSLQYDSHHPDTGLYNGNTVLQQSEVVKLEGTNTWRTKVFQLDDMRMANGIGGQYDFRIGLYCYRDYGNSPAEIAFSTIRVKQGTMSNPVNVSISTDKLGNIFSDSDEIVLHRSIANKSNETMHTEYTTSVYNKFTGAQVYKSSGSADIDAGDTISDDLNVPDKMYSIYTITTTQTSYPTNDPSSKMTEVYNDEYSVSIKLDANSGDNNFGFQTQIISLGRGDCEEVNTLQTQIGASWNRDGIPWNSVEKSKGVLKLPADAKEKLRYQKDNGINNLLICSRYNSLYDDGLTPTSDEAINAFANYCGFLAKELNGIVDCFEIWNEYNNSAFNNNPNADEENYVKILKASYEAIKSANPNAAVIGFGTVGVPSAWIKNVIKAGALEYCDAVSCHPYDWDGAFNENTLKNNLNTLKSLMKTYGGIEKPIWVTEIGFSTISAPMASKPAYTGYTQKEQAEAIVLANTVLKAYDLCDMTIGYCLYDRDNDEDIECCWGLLNYWGADSNGKPRNGAKESYLAVAAMSKYIGNCNSYVVQNYSVTASRLYAVKFYNNTLQKGVLVLQCANGKTGTKSFNLGCSEVELYDMYGNKKGTMQSESGSYSFDITQEPCYVVGNFN